MMKTIQLTILMKNEEENEVDGIDITENIVTEDSADLTVQKRLRHYW